MNVKMITRRLLSLVAALLILFPSAAIPTAVPTTLTFSYDFTLPFPLSAPACSATVTANCISGFTLTTSLNNALVSNVAVPLPTTISTTGPTVGITVALPAITSMGVYSWCLVANYKGTGTITGSGATACQNAVYPLAPVITGVQ